MACIEHYTLIAAPEHYVTQNFVYRDILDDGFMWSTDKEKSGDAREKYRYMPVIFMHEFGHAGGLAHSPDLDSAMYKSERSDVQDLTSDDIAGMEAVYKNHAH